MILGYNELKWRVEELFPNEPPYKIGAASVDVRLGSHLILENNDRVDITWTTQHHPFYLTPGMFVLADMFETTYVPLDLSCMFMLKSTIARLGIQHAHAGWVDPGWKGVLTMELKNVNLTKPLKVYHGQPIGQLIFMATSGAGTYRGRYQNSTEVSGPRSEVRYDAG